MTLPALGIRVQPLAPLDDVASDLMVAMEHRLRLPHPAILVDLARLIRGGPLPFPSRDLGEREYDHLVLGRIRGHHRLPLIQDALLGLPEGVRAQGVGLLLATLTARLLDDAAIQPIRPAELRAFLGSTGPPSLAPCLLADARLQLATAMSRASAVFTRADVEVTHILTHLPTASERMAHSDMLQIREEIRRCARAPHRHRSMTPRRPGTAEQSNETADAADHIGLEYGDDMGRVVPSELVWLDAPDAPDLFERRWADGTLLCRKRRGTGAVTPRTPLLVTVDAPPVTASHRPPGARFQTRLVVLGALLVWLETAASRDTPIWLHLADDRDRQQIRLGTRSLRNLQIPVEPPQDPRLQHVRITIPALGEDWAAWGRWTIVSQA